MLDLNNLPRVGGVRVIDLYSVLKEIILKAASE